MKKYIETAAMVILLLAALVILLAFLNTREGAQGLLKRRTLGMTSGPAGETPPFINGMPAEDFSKISNIPVFMYHHIGDVPPGVIDRYRPDLTVSTEAFASEIEYLKQQGYRCISTAELYAFSQQKITLTAKPCVITMDDGFEDAFQNAVPILTKNGMVGSFAIITDYVGTKVGDQRYASWPTIAAAQLSGMEIIPHTQHHIDFYNKKYSHKTKVQEVLGSILDIQTHLGVTPIAFVYPYGHYTPEVEQILKASGIKIAFTTVFGSFRADSDNLTEPRVRVHGAADLKLFIKNLESAQGR